MNVSFQLLRIKNIAGILYSTGENVDTLVIYGLGAPMLPDNGTLADASIIMQFAVDLFVPDYIGYGRSDGRFTPQNCLQTFLQLYKDFTRGCIGENFYAKEKRKLQYRKIIFIGRSLGGTYVPLLPRFNPDIRELGLLYPAVENASCGTFPGEETNEDFLKGLQEDYRHIYRGVNFDQWQKHLNDKDDELSPMNNIHFLDKTNMFIAHGKNDTCIHFSKSQKYFENIKKFFPNSSRFRLQLYEGGHNILTSNPACKDMLHWFRIPLRINCL